MNNETKVVLEIPLKSFCADNKDVFERKEKDLTKKDIQEILKKHAVEFVVADVGKKLEWISLENSYGFWKTELNSHLADDTHHIQLENFSDNYAYVASEWTREYRQSVILLEKYH